MIKSVRPRPVLSMSRAAGLHQRHVYTRWVVGEWAMCQWRGVDDVAAVGVPVEVVVVVCR